MLGMYIFRQLLLANDLESSESQHLPSQLTYLIKTPLTLFTMQKMIQGFGD